jgi:hypothetical protein
MRSLYSGGRIECSLIGESAVTFSQIRCDRYGSPPHLGAKFECLWFREVFAENKDINPQFSSVLPRNQILEVLNPGPCWHDTVARVFHFLISNFDFLVLGVSGFP